MVVLTIMALAACGTDDSHDDPAAAVDLTAPPTNLVWDTYQGVHLPTAAEGPHQVSDDGVPYGFSQQPAGAALAAINATIRMSVAPDSEWAAVARTLIAPGAARDHWAVARAQISITEPVVAAKAPTVTGYRITRFQPDDTTVQVFTRQADRSLTQNTITAVWREGDWRIVLPGEDSAPVVSAISAVPTDTVSLRPPTN